MLPTVRIPHGRFFICLSPDAFAAKHDAISSFRLLSGTGRGRKLVCRQVLRSRQGGSTKSTWATGQAVRPFDIYPHP